MTSNLEDRRADQHDHDDRRGGAEQHLEPAQPPLGRHVVRADDVVGGNGRPGPGELALRMQPDLRGNWRVIAEASDFVLLERVGP